MAESGQEWEGGGSPWALLPNQNTPVWAGDKHQDSALLHIPSKEVHIRTKLTLAAAAQLSQTQSSTKPSSCSFFSISSFFSFSSSSHFWSNYDALALFLKYFGRVCHQVLTTPRITYYYYLIVKTMNNSYSLPKVRTDLHNYFLT